VEVLFVNPPAPSGATTRPINVGTFAGRDFLLSLTYHRVGTARTINYTLLAGQPKNA